MQEPSKANPKDKKSDWETPDALFGLINTYFGPFNLDAAANAENSKCAFYWSEADDGLSKPWQGNVWCNPPYTNVGAWIKKGYEEAAIGNGNVTMLVGARPDTQYWWDYARHAQVIFIKGRITFKGAPSGADFPSAILHFPCNLWQSPSTTYWNLTKEQRR